MRNGFHENEYGYYEDDYGTKRWYKNIGLHREDGPAVVYSDGSQIWLVDNNIHREDGPAIIHSNGTHKWYVNGKYITNEVNQWFTDVNLTYETLEFEDKMALKFFIRGLAT